MSKVYCQVYRMENHQLIADRVEVARSFFSRLRGLLGRKTMSAGSGMLLQPCSSIHCYGMQFPIDAIFLDHQYRVISISENMQPGAIASEKGACCVMELCAGEAGKHNITVGEQLELCCI